jgi:energy-coupling factor transporter transmembrane protein EcfT
MYFLPIQLQILLKWYKYSLNFGIISGYYQLISSGVREILDPRPAPISRLISLGIRSLPSILEMLSNICNVRYVHYLNFIVGTLNKKKDADEINFHNIR